MKVRFSGRNLKRGGPGSPSGSTRPAAPERSARHAPRAERSSEVVANPPVVESRAARENIHRRIGMLRPGMDRDMRLRNDDHAADAVRHEIVKHRFDDFAAALAHRRAKERLYRPRAPQALGVALVILQQGVVAKGAHGSDGTGSREHKLQASEQVVRGSHAIGIGFLEDGDAAEVGVGEDKVL